MTETLTESFCERCGTRYTFESARPRVRLKSVRVLSRGLKNFVLSDDSTMDEAMAAARSETDRELTAHQLDAFHATFNFCMSCRQYTCPNCWNEVEARCLSCAPRLGHEVMPAPFPDLPATAVLIGEPASINGNGSHDVDEAPDFAARLAALTGAAETTDEASSPEAPVDVVAVEPPVEASVHDVVAVEPIVEASAETDVAVEPLVEASAETDVAVEPLVEASAETDVAVEDFAPATETSAPPAAAVVEPEDRTATPAWLAALAAGAVIDGAKPDEATHDVSIEDKAAAQTEGLLERFRPDEGLDAEPGIEPLAEPDTAVGETTAGIDATTEREAAAIEAAALAAAEREAAEIEAATLAEAHAQAEARALAEAQAQARAEAEAATLAEAALAEAARAAAKAEAAMQAEAARKAAEIEATALAAAALEAARQAEADAAAAQVAAEAEAAARAAAAAAPVDDFVQQPTWRMVAPDPGNETPFGRPGDPATVSPPAAIAANPNAEPQWPTRPAAAGNGLPFLNRLPTPQGGLEALWAESNREVVSTPLIPGKSVTGGIQPCLSCGLSLSANARFCRRCGTPQAS